MINGFMMWNKMPPSIANHLIANLSTIQQQCYKPFCTVLHFTTDINIYVETLEKQILLIGRKLSCRCLSININDTKYIEFVPL